MYASQPIIMRSPSAIFSCLHSSIYRGMNSFCEGFLHHAWLSAFSHSVCVHLTYASSFHFISISVRQSVSKRLSGSGMVQPPPPFSPVAPPPVPGGSLATTPLIPTLTPFPLPRSETTPPWVRRHPSPPSDGPRLPSSSSSSPDSVPSAPPFPPAVPQPPPPKWEVAWRRTLVVPNCWEFVLPRTPLTIPQ